MFVRRATAGGLLVGRAIVHCDGEVGDLTDVGSRDGDDNIMGCSMGMGYYRGSTLDAQTICTGVIFLILREVVC